ncbi:MAG: hypothetical protein GX359_11610 [Clostridiales bacterium]|nr:hypothetical protein [Clostridiales bacterium]
MLLNAKKMAFLGLLLSVDIILVILSGVFEFNTLFLLGAAAFCVGIAIREVGIALGLGFYIASILLGLMLAPNKLYCITYGGMGLYIIAREFAWEKLASAKHIGNRNTALWIIKYTAFNLMYLPILLFLPKLIYQGDLSKVVLLLLLIGGQIIFYIYDRAYDYFQGSIWSRIRHKFK